MRADEGGEELHSNGKQGSFFYGEELTLWRIGLVTGKGVVYLLLILKLDTNFFKIFLCNFTVNNSL